MRGEYLLKDPRETKLAVIDTLIDAYTHNARIIARKNGVFMWAFAFTAAATVLLGAALIGNIAWNSYTP